MTITEKNKALLRITIFIVRVLKITGCNKQN